MAHRRRGSHQRSANRLHTLSFQQERLQSRRRLAARRVGLCSFQNLPELISSWEQSQLKERYLNSTNYHQLQHRHLALKLISRWQEFNAAAGFPLDLNAIGSSTDGAAAVAYRLRVCGLRALAGIRPISLCACVIAEL